MISYVVCSVLSLGVGFCIGGFVAGRMWRQEMEKLFKANIDKEKRKKLWKQL